MLIRVKVYEKETLDKKKKFNTYKAVQKNGTLIDLKFTQAVTLLPKEECFIVVPDTSVNMDVNRLYPCLWCKEVTEIKPIVKKEVVDEKVTEMFSYDEDDLPF